MDRARNCQSCGMPAKMDPAGGGTEADGTLSPLFCSHCYQNGVFTQPNITREEMVAQVRQMVEHKAHMPKFISKWITRNIHKLQRWQ